MPLVTEARRRGAKVVLVNPAPGRSAGERQQRLPGDPQLDQRLADLLPGGLLAERGLQFGLRDAAAVDELLAQAFRFPGGRRRP